MKTLTLKQAKKTALPRRPQWVTYTTMLTTDGMETYYATYRAPLYAAGKKPYINLNHPKVDRRAITWTPAGVNLDCLETSRRFATNDYPAFQW